MNKILAYACIALVVTISMLGYGYRKARLEIVDLKVEVKTLTESVSTLSKRTGVSITLAPEIKSTAVLGKVSNVSLTFKPGDIVAALQAYRDSLPSSLTITTTK